mgnify:CR=1 FL=1
MRVFNELEVELIEVCRDIDTLKLMVVVLIDEDEVRVDFKAPILSQDDTDLVPRAALTTHLRDGPILYQRGWRHAGVICQDAKLDEPESILGGVFLNSQETNLTRFAILEDDGAYFVAHGLHGYDFELLAQV